MSLKITNWILTCINTSDVYTHVSNRVVRLRFLMSHVSRCHTAWQCEFWTCERCSLWFCVLCCSWTHSATSRFSDGTYDLGRGYPVFSAVRRPTPLFLKSGYSSRVPPWSCRGLRRLRNKRTVSMLIEHPPDSVSCPLSISCLIHVLLQPSSTDTCVMGNLAWNLWELAHQAPEYIHGNLFFF